MMDDSYRAPDPSWSSDTQASDEASFPGYNGAAPNYPPTEPDPSMFPPPPAYMPPPAQQWQSGPIGGPAPSGPLPPQQPQGQQGYYQTGAPTPMPQWQPNPTGAPAPSGPLPPQMPPQQQWQSGPMGGPPPSIPLPQGPQGYYYPPSGPLPPQQGYYQQQSVPLQQGYYPPVVIVQQQTDNSSAAVAVECIAGFFGFYGIGWLMSGYTAAGIIMLICGFIWDSIYVTIAVLTIGIGLICLVPLDAIIWGTSAVLLNNKLKERRMGIGR